MHETDPYEWLLAPLALAALGWLAFSGHRRRRRQTLVGALEMYAADHGTYPKSLFLLVPRYLKAVPRGVNYHLARQGDDYFLSA